MPDVTGMELSEAKKILKELGLEVEIEGEGAEEMLVTDQLPKKGISVSSGTKVTVYVEWLRKDKIENWLKNVSQSVGVALLGDPQCIEEITRKCRGDFNRPFFEARANKFAPTNCDINNSHKKSNL